MTPDPHYFLEEFVNPSRICRILDLTILIEEVGNFREIAVRESAHQIKLAQDRQQTLEDARAANTAGETPQIPTALRMMYSFKVGIEGIKSGPNCAVGWDIHPKAWLHPGSVDSPPDSLEKKIA